MSSFCKVVTRVQKGEELFVQRERNTWYEERLVPYKGFLGVRVSKCIRDDELYTQVLCSKKVT